MEQSIKTDRKMKPTITYWTKKKLGNMSEQCFDTMIASSNWLKQ